MYQTSFKSDAYHYLLFDNNHFSPILDIKQFLNVRAFCYTCQKAFVNTQSFTDHACDENKNEEVDPFSNSGYEANQKCH